MGQKVLLFYIYAMTILTFSICGADKFAAQRQRRTFEIDFVLI